MRQRQDGFTSEKTSVNSIQFIAILYTIVISTIYMTCHAIKVRQVAKG
jgi:hypothetical protein